MTPRLPVPQHSRTNTFDRKGPFTALHLDLTELFRKGMYFIGPAKHRYRASASEPVLGSDAYALLAYPSLCTALIRIRPVNRNHTAPNTAECRENSLRHDVRSSSSVNIGHPALQADRTKQSRHGRNCQCVIRSFFTVSRLSNRPMLKISTGRF